MIAPRCLAGDAFVRWVLHLAHPDHSVRDLTLHEVMDVGHGALHRGHHRAGDAGADVVSKPCDLGFHGRQQAISAIERNATDGRRQIDLKGVIILAMPGELDKRIFDLAISLAQGM